MRGECSVCSKGAAAFVDDELDRGTFLDDIAAKLAQQDPPMFIHRSSIFRHKVAHYLPRLRLRALERKSQKPGRLLIEWPENWNSPATVAGKITLSDPEFCADAPVIVAACQLRESDVLLTVSFETTPVRNAQTLKPEPSGEQTMPEEKADEEKKSDGLFTRLRKLFGQDKPAEQPAATPVEPPETPEQIQARCQHVMSDAVDGGRCQACGFQPPKWRPVGISRADFAAARRRF
jgi:hypothetical protein